MNSNTQLKPRLARGNYLFLFFLILFIIVLILVGFFVYQKAKAFGASGGPLSAPLPEFEWSPTGDPSIISSGHITATAQAPLGPVPVPWDGASRVTVLVVGLDYRDWEKGEGPPRTDTMILLTLDPLSKTAGMMNIPRDLWIGIPGGFSYGRINTAYPLGEAYDYPGGGPGLVIDTVEAFLGVPINYFAQVDFEAFERFIDEIGGIEIDVPEEIKVDPIGEHNTVVLKPGKQMLDGPVALAYARARYTEGGDFDRAARQQQVIKAIRARMLQLDMLSTLMARAPELYQELSSGVHTNLSLEQAFSLAWLAAEVPGENIREGIIGPPNHVILTKSPDGTQDVLKPVMVNIHQLRDEIFAAAVPVAPGVEKSSDQDLMGQEQARIVLLNGSGVPGLASITQEYLTSTGANIVQTGDATEYFARTTIVDHTGNPYTVRYLRALMNVESGFRRLEYYPASETDVVVYLGADWAAANPMP